MDTSSLIGWGADGLAFRTELAVMLIRLGQLPGPLDRDFDGDGLSDAWEWENDLNPNWAADAGADPDGDGVSTRDEVEAGTRHASATSVLILREMSQMGDLFRVRFDGVIGRRYQVETAPNLGGSWHSVGPLMDGSGMAQTIEVTRPVGTESALIRLRVLAP